MSAVPVAEVRAYLGSDAGDDALLQTFIDGAEVYVSQKNGGHGGLLLSTAVTQRADGYGRSLILTKLPVVSVESVTDPSGTVLTLGTLDVDLAAGLIRYDTTGSCRFPCSFYTVAYHAGYAALPADLIQAVKSRTAYAWATQRGPRDQNDDAEAERARCDSILASRPIPGFA